MKRMSNGEKLSIGLTILSAALAIASHFVDGKLEDVAFENRFNELYDKRQING